MVGTEPQSSRKQPVLFDPQCPHDLTQSSVLTVPGDLMSSSGLLASVGNRYKGDKQADKALIAININDTKRKME